jgi:hypothetical protein
MIVSILALFLQCSKDTPAPAPATGCTFTFKGTSYNLQNSICSNDAGGKINAATNTIPSSLLTLYKDGATDGIVFALDALNSNDDNVYNSFGTGGSYSITISGTTWTFSGTLISVNEMDSGTISGTCGCTVSN